MIEKEETMIALLKTAPEYRGNWTKDTEKEVGKTIGQAISNSVNNFFVNSREIAEALFDSKKASITMDHIAAAWVAVLNGQYKQEAYDDRNAYSTKIGQQLYKLPDIAAFIRKNGCAEYAPYMRDKKKTLTCYHTGMYVADYMSREHRTLQQTFSEIVFLYLKQKFPKLDKTLGDRWTACPLI